MTYEEKIAIVVEMEKKHNITRDAAGDTTRAKILFLTNVMLELGIGRNASTVTALRFIADMMESAIPQRTPPEQLASEQLERALKALDADDLPKA